jgi:hypothetical protein
MFPPNHYFENGTRTEAYQVKSFVKPARMPMADFHKCLARNNKSRSMVGVSLHGHETIWTKGQT